MGRELRERRVNRFAACQLARVLDHVRDFRECQSAFAHEAFVCAFSQVSGERRMNVVFVRFHSGMQLAQLLQAEFYGNRSAAVKERALLCHQGLDFFAGHFQLQSDWSATCS